MRRWMLVVWLIAGALAAGPMPASATPGNGAAQSTFVMSCDGEPRTFTVGGGSWAAAYILEQDSRFIPQATYLHVFDDATGELLLEEADVKHRSGKGAETVCVEEFVVDGVRISFAVHGKLR